jgi:hypothetical protein
LLYIRLWSPITHRRWRSEIGHRTLGDGRRKTGDWQDAPPPQPWEGFPSAFRRNGWERFPSAFRRNGLPSETV